MFQGTQSVKDIIYSMTGFDIEKTNKEDIEQMFKQKEIAEKACSPMDIIHNISPQRPPSTPLASLNRSKHQSFDLVDTKKRENSENPISTDDLQQDMQAMQDNYQ